jgi:hypothetical protein
MSYRQTVDFLLYDWLDVAALRERPRFAEHSRETFDSVLDTCERIAREKFAPFNRVADTEEPWFDGEKVHLPQASHAAAQAYFESGMLAAAQDYEIGGMQLPCVVEMAANSFFSKAGIGIGGGGMLTSGNANLLMVHGTPLQQEVFAKNEFAGRFSGTMCLSEPQAGSSLSDIVTRAVPDGADFASDPLGPRYRLRGNKMWISNGEHEITENIVHLVLAKIPDDDGKPFPGRAASRSSSCRRSSVDSDGRLTGERNDVALAGLNHKLGYRGIPNTLLNFGEGKFRSAAQAAAASTAPDPAPWATSWPAGPGPALHVPHDERGAHRRRPRRDDARLRRLRSVARVRRRAGRREDRSVPAARTRASRRSASSSTPTSSACCSRRRAIAKARSRSSSIAPSSSTSCTPVTTRPGALASAARSADADRQELAERVVPGSEQPGDPGARRLRLHARLSRSSSTGATTGST